MYECETEYLQFQSHSYLEEINTGTGFVAKSESRLNTSIWNMAAGQKAWK